MSNKYPSGLILKPLDMFQFIISSAIIKQDGSLQSYRQYVQGLPLSEPPEAGAADATGRNESCLPEGSYPKGLIRIFIDSSLPGKT